MFHPSVQKLGEEFLQLTEDILNNDNITEEEYYTKRARMLVIKAEVEKREKELKKRGVL